MPNRSCVFHLWEFNDYVKSFCKRDTNVESKSKNDSGIEDESQKFEKFTDFLFILIKLLWLI